MARRFAANDSHRHAYRDTSQQQFGTAEEIYASIPNPLAPDTAKEWK